MQTMERTFAFDRDLVRRANRKVRRYGISLDDALRQALVFIVTIRGRPDFLSNPNTNDTHAEVPGPLLLDSFAEAERMERGLVPAKSYSSSAELIADCLK